MAKRDRVHERRAPAVAEENVELPLVRLERVQELRELERDPRRGIGDEDTGTVDNRGAIVGASLDDDVAASRT
jgi:hypothetical protein